MNTDKDKMTILVVEDDTQVRDLTRDMLKCLGYSVVVADTAQDALQICTSNKPPIDLILTDVEMPDVTGVELRDQIADVQPKIKVLFTSGHSSDIIVDQGVLKADEPFIQKPYTMKDLVQKMKEVVTDKPKKET